MAGNSEAVDITLFIPCYNEALNIVRTLDTICAALSGFTLSYELLIIDDASTDNSVEVIQNYSAQHPTLPIKLIVNKENKGLAYNFVEGAFLGCGKYYRQINGDNDEPKETLIRVFQNMGKADMIITFHEQNIQRSFMRKIISKMFTFIINLISGHSIKYYNGLTLHHRVNVMRWHSRSQGFGYQADLTTRLLDRGFSYIEVPVVVQDRQAGDSNALTWDNLLSTGHLLMELIIRRIRKAYS